MKRILLSSLSIGLLLARAAGAQGPDAAAQLLFDDGKKLLAAGKVSEACPKFEESHRLVPNGGTLTNLAECLELDGKLASAWLRYKELAARANVGERALKTI